MPKIIELNIDVEDVEDFNDVVTQMIEEHIEQYVECNDHCVIPSRDCYNDCKTNCTCTEYIHSACLNFDAKRKEYEDIGAKYFNLSDINIQPYNYREI